MPNVMGREFPYTPQGMAEAQQYKEALGMRDGGSMGFRPVGYDVGGEVGLKERLIEEIMQITGMTDVGTLLEMSVPDLQNALSGLLGNEQGMMPPGQMMSPPDMRPNSPGVVPNEGGGFDYYPPQTGMEQTMPDPTGVPPEGGDQMIMQRPYRFPVNPDTGSPWTDEERGPMRRTPKEDGRGYYTGDNSGNMTSTMEFVPSRYPPGFFEDAIKPLQMPPPPVQRAGGGIMSLGRR
jgi:hypothetical protein